MKKYAIYAYDNTYGGLHGYESYAIADFVDLKEAEMAGAEISRNVINDYGLVDDEMEAYINSEDYDEEESYGYEDELIEEDIAYEIYEIVDTKGLSNEELESEFYNNKEDFIKNYCKEV